MRLVNNQISQKSLDFKHLRDAKKRQRARIVTLQFNQSPGSQTRILDKPRSVPKTESVTNIREGQKRVSSKSVRDLAIEGNGSKETGSTQVGVVLLVSALALTALIALVGFNQRYWLLPPHEKLEQSWKQDTQLLLGTKQGELLKRVAKIRVRSDGHSPADEWLEKVKAPIDLNKEGDLLADIFVIHQIDKNRYGVVVQYEFIQLKDQNKIGEFARTLWLGIYY